MLTCLNCAFDSCKPTPHQLRRRSFDASLAVAPHSCCPPHASAACLRVALAAVLNAGGAEVLSTTHHDAGIWANNMLNGHRVSGCRRGWEGVFFSFFLLACCSSLACHAAWPLLCMLCVCTRRERGQPGVG
jgi:hypothetical protein